MPSRYHEAKKRLIKECDVEYRRIYRFVAQEMPATRGETRTEYKKRMSTIRMEAIQTLVKNNIGRYRELLKEVTSEGFTRT